MSDIDGLVRLHESAKERLSERARILAEQESAARAHLESIAAERRRLEIERQTLVEAEKVYRKMYGWAEPLSLSPHEEPVIKNTRRPMLTEVGRANLESAEPQRTRARIGPQRFQMFMTLKNNGHMSLEEIAFTTDLPGRRVKDQMGADLASKNVAVIDGQYQLTESGLDLLTRYIEYKRSKDEPLPPLSGPAAEEERDDGEDGPQPQNQGALAA